jgi:hypothetical protein
LKKELEVYQYDSDKEIVGNLTKVFGNTIHEFPALRKESKNLIPFLHTNRPDFGEVYPLVAIRHGWGYLIMVGMHTKSEKEFKK